MLTGGLFIGGFVSEDDAQQDVEQRQIRSPVRSEDQFVSVFQLEEEAKTFAPGIHEKVESLFRHKEPGAETEEAKERLVEMGDDGLGKVEFWVRRGYKSRVDRL